MGVAVACAIPQGLRLRLFDIGEQIDTGVKIAFERPAFVILHGKAKGEPGPDGTWITRDVDETFFATWLEQNAASPLVLNRQVFRIEP
jgi:hypothetical protein